VKDQPRQEEEELIPMARGSTVSSTLSARTEGSSPPNGYFLGKPRSG